MTPRDKNQKSHALVSLFKTQYKKRYGENPKLNAYSAKYGMGDVMEDVGYERTRELIEYYFTCEARHSVTEFLNTYDSIDTLEQARKSDEEERRKLREETRRRIQG